MTYNLNNVALPEEEARDLGTHVKLCSIRHAQMIDEIRKTNDNLEDLFEKLETSLKEDLKDYISSNNERHKRNEKVFVAAFFVIAASLWPQLVNILAPIASAFTGFVIPAARAISGL